MEGLGELGLTDDDGPYDEIQAGRYETQLNYEFMPPRRVEAFTEYWYPLRGLGNGFVEANHDLALNVRFLPATGAEKQHAEVAIYPTVAMSGVKIEVAIDPPLSRIRTNHTSPVNRPKV